MAGFDAVLVLGGGLTPNGEVPEHAKQQLNAAAAAMRAGKTEYMITTGAQSYKAGQSFKTTEAQAYKAYAGSQGIDPAHIFTEENSKDTLGNIYFAKVQLLLPKQWHKLLIVPSFNHRFERVTYLLQKVLGPGYTWEFLSVPHNKSLENARREDASLTLTRKLNDAFTDGDHEAIYQGMLKTHPAYSQSPQISLEDMRRLLG